MPAKISDIEYALLFASGDGFGTTFAFIDRETGLSYFLSDYIDDPELPDGFETTDDFDGDDRFVSVPHKNELDLGRELIHDFMREFMPEHENAVYDIFRSKGAYRRYKDFLESKNRLDDWHKFEREQTQAKLREWCAESGIELSD